MNALDLLRRVVQCEVEQHARIDGELLREIEQFVKKPPTAVNVTMRGTQVMSVMGPLEPTEAMQYAKIAASVGGVRVTTTRLFPPPTIKND